MNKILNLDIHNYCGDFDVIEIGDSLPKEINSESEDEDTEMMNRESVFSQRRNNCLPPHLAEIVEDNDLGPLNKKRVYDYANNVDAEDLDELRKRHRWMLPSQQKEVQACARLGITYDEKLESEVTEAADIIMNIHDLTARERRLTTSERRSLAKSANLAKRIVAQNTTDENMALNDDVSKFQHACEHVLAGFWGPTAASRSSGFSISAICRYFIYVSFCF